MHSRRGITLIEVVTVAAVFAVLLGILVPAVQRAREQARRDACRDNLRMVGMALSEYHDIWGCLPPTIASDGKLDIGTSPHALIALGLWQAYHPLGYDPKVHWSKASAEVAGTVFPEFLCPSRTHPEVVSSPSLGLLGLPVGSEFATTDYLLSKGPNDSWCLPEGPHKFGPVANDVRGAFGLGQVTRLKDIADGQGTTMVMGEGAAGPRWPTIRRDRPLEPYRHPTTGEAAESYNFWISPRINTTKDQAQHGLVMTGLFGTTAVPLNNRYIMETLADSEALDDCRPSAKGGPHRTSGFRSEHQAGGMFLFADGTVHFLHENLDSGLYRAFSTIQGEETIHFGN